MMDSPLKKLRETLELSEQELATLAGVSQGHVSNVERGIADLGDKLEVFLTKIKADVTKIINCHKLFMEARRKEMQSKLQRSNKR